MFRRNIARMSAAVTGVVVLTLTVAGTATAATARNGVCETGEFCLYWGSNFTGSVSDFDGSLSNYGSSQPTCYEFRTPGMPGYQQCVKNNAASARNKTQANNVTVYAGSGFVPPSDFFAPGQARNLNSGVQNNNGSHRFVHV